MEKILLRFPRKLRHAVPNAIRLFEQKQPNLKKTSPIFSSAFDVASKRNKHDDTRHVFSTHSGPRTRTYSRRQAVDIKERYLRF